MDESLRLPSRSGYIEVVLVVNLLKCSRFFEQSAKRFVALLFAKLIRKAKMKYIFFWYVVLLKEPTTSTVPAYHGTKSFILFGGRGEDEIIIVKEKCHLFVRS